METFLLIDIHEVYSANYQLWLSLPLSLKEKILAYQELQQPEPIFTIFQKMLMVIFLILVVSFINLNSQD